jgi:hypothetical protein
MLSAADAERISIVTREFCDALALATAPSTSNEITTKLKDDAREEAERVVRLYGGIIRANPEIPVEVKMVLNVKERPKKLSKRLCPQTAPQLTYAGKIRETASGEGLHMLRYVEKTGAGTHAKPTGAVRVELCAGLPRPNDEPPTDPSALSGGLLWHLGSWTKSPIRVQYPLPAEPMRVLYWACWAGASGKDGKCQTGPWSETCDGGIVHCTRAGALRIEDERDDRPRRVPVIIEQLNPIPLLPECQTLKALPNAA